MSDSLPAASPTPPEPRECVHALAAIRHDVQSCARRIGALQTELHHQQSGLTILEDRLDEHDRAHAAAAKALQRRIDGLDAKTDQVLVLLEALKELFQPRAVL